MATDIYSMLTSNYDPRAQQMQQQQAFQQQLGRTTDPRAFIAAVGSNLGGQLGGAAQGMFGGASPEQQKDKLKQEAMAEVQASGVDMTDQIAVLKAITQALAKRGLTAEAAQVSANIPTAKPAEPTNLNKLLSEQARFPEGSPQWNAYQGAIDKETQGAEKATKTQVVTYNNKQVLINSDDGSVIRELGAAPSKAPVINIAGNQENEFAKARGKNQADELAEANKAAGSSKVALNALNQMEKVNTAGIYSGPQADALLATNSFLESVGLLNKDQVSKLTNSVAYDKNAKDLVMLDLDGKLGAQVSDADRKYVEARIPQLRTNPQARTELIAKLREIHSNKIDKAEKMKEWANSEGNLNKFKWNPPQPKTSSQGWSIKKVQSNG